MSDMKSINLTKEDLEKVNGGSLMDELTAIGKDPKFNEGDKVIWIQRQDFGVGIVNKYDYDFCWVNFIDGEGLLYVPTGQLRLA